jgi:predicted metal-dependent peptidase
VTRPIGSEEAAARAVTAARAALVLGRDAKSAFFATLALRLIPAADRSVPTMATDGRRLVYHPDFVLGLSKDERIGVLVHEVMHCALTHFARRAGRDLGTWNIACDLAVNPLLLDAGFVLPAGRLVPGEGSSADLQAGKSAEEYYRLLQDRVGTGNDTGTTDPISTGGDSPPFADPGGCGGVLDPVDASPVSTRQAETDWAVAVSQAEQVAIGRGDLPAGLGRTVTAIVHRPADWRSVLRAFVSTHARNDYSWSRPNRRYLSQGLYLPGLHSDELDEVVIAVDTSGSVGKDELGLFAAELTALLSSYDCRATVLYHDRTVQKVQSWAPADGPLVFDPVGGGGTCHVCVFEWVDQAGLDPACVVCLTDLETRFPTRPPPVPVLWAQVGNASVDPPFGSVIHLSP